MEYHARKLKRLGACSEAIEWAKQFSSEKEAWQKCERGDWLLWYVGRMSGKPESKSRKKFVLAACKCARLSLKYVPKASNRPLKAIQTAEKWAKGDNITLQDVRIAADAAYTSSYAAHAVTYAVAYAAYAANAALAAALAAEAVHADYRKRRTLKKCANIVRKFYPEPPKKA